MINKVEHLDNIQTTAVKLSLISYLLKGWTILLVAILIFLSTKEISNKYIVLAFVSVIVFWGLDGYILRQKRAYGELYDKVKKSEGDELENSMGTREIKKIAPRWIDVTFSKSPMVFYIALIVLILVVLLVVL